ncbi:MAG: 16S rRNA (guanine(527)-N(7))-methyltransferase RsmG [Bacteroidota bacterium]
MESFHLLSKYFPDLSPTQVDQIEQLGPLYKSWNERINVVSRKDIQELYIRHVLHSLGIARYVQFNLGAAVMDVGTGGGFPGIPLAILFPETEFLLVDSIGKKIKVVNGVAESVGLKNVTAIQERAENIDQKFDFIVSRAVTRIGPFYQWIKKKFKKESTHDCKNGIFYLKGGDLKEELQASRLRYKLHDLDQEFEEPFFETKKVLYVPKQ